MSRRRPARGSGVVRGGGHSGRAGPAPAAIGHRAAVRSLADVAAMGAVPTALLVALAAPPGLASSWALDLATGLAAEAERAGATVAGGDTARFRAVPRGVTRPGGPPGRARAGTRPAPTPSCCPCPAWVTCRDARRCPGPEPGRATWSRWPGR